MRGSRRLAGPRQCSIVSLPRSSDGEFRRGHVTRNRRPGADGRAFADPHWRDQFAAGSDVGAALDHRVDGPDAVVVARDRPRANGHTVAEISVSNERMVIDAGSRRRSANDLIST